jgi:DNA-binding protein HU-beta
LNKSQLVEAVAKDTGLSKSQAGNALDSITDHISKTLGSGDDVALTGFGKFSVSNRAARTARNPQTGEPIMIKATKAPRFSAGATLKQAVAGR